MRTVRGPVLNTEGTDIVPIVNAAAAEFDVDAVHLLALLWAESEGADPYAERWGSRTEEAQSLIERIDAGNDGARAELRLLLMDGENVGMDVSFGPSQYIIPYHYRGDRRLTVDNCLGVRAYVFSHYDEDIRMAAKKYRACRDGVADRGDPQMTALAAVVAYNSGGDNLDTEWYPRKYAGNLQRYRDKLAWAEGYAQGPMTPAEVIKKECDDFWHVANLLDSISAHDLANEVRQSVINIKIAAGIN